jgi:predicted phage terminase large subunit-like protein
MAKIDIHTKPANPVKRTLSEMQEQVISAENLKPQQVNPLELLRLEMLTSFEKYTKAMFKAQYKRSFIVAEHHKRIFQALQDVVDGKCRRLIINMPPRYGKCTSKNSLITMEDGTLCPAEFIRPGDKVLSFRNGKAVANIVLGTEPAFKPSLKITMRSGRSITVSHDHPMLSTFGYVKAEDFKPGDRIQALCTELDGKESVTDDEILLVSMIIFDGCCSTPGRLGFTNIDELAVKAVYKAIKNLGGEVKHYECQHPAQHIIKGGKNSPIHKILEKHNLIGHNSYTKRISPYILSSSLRQKYIFLGMMIATDGTIKKGGQITIGLANELLAKDIQVLLSSVGIPSAVNFYVNDKANVWVVSISKSYAQILYPHINFYSKQDIAKERIFQNTKIERTCTYPYEIIKKEGLYKKAHFDMGFKWCGPNRNISKNKFTQLVKAFPQLQKYICEDFYLDEIKSIEPVGNQELIHLEVENDHNYIANGLVSHNTEIAIKSFISWCFSLNPKCRFLHLSYSDILVKDNSETIRGIMKEELYKSLFPKSTLESEKASNTRWKTAAGGELYAVSTQGQVTGFGAGNVDATEDDLARMEEDNTLLSLNEDINEVLEGIGARTNVFQGAILIDDPMKPEDADSEIIRERINLRFENTIRNRTNSRNTPIIIIMQRLHEHDLCGYLQEIEPEEWTVLSLPAIQVDPETGEEHALWPMKHTLEELRKMRDVNPLVFDTQYMQDPTPREGLMYADGFRTYSRDALPVGSHAIKKWNYTDTADTGSDMLCSICFIDTPEFVYVTDVLFTDASMEITETQTAELYTRNNTVNALVESNNGGRAFARNVKRILRATLRNFRCAVNSFTQTQNKASRIYANSACCMNDILFPEGWERKWPKFYAALMGYRKDNKKKQHDDAPDCLTGVYEMHAKKNRTTKIKLRN